MQKVAVKEVFTCKFFQEASILVGSYHFHVVIGENYA